jgi:DNA polymerase
LTGTFFYYLIRIPDKADVIIVVAHSKKYYALISKELILAGKKDMDMEKAARQHLEMEGFFSGGFINKDPNHIHLDRRQSPNKSAELEEIAVNVHNCRKCELGLLRTNAVPGEGIPDARIVFIGEAPGADEDAQGRPFVGRAGQLLDKIINAMGLKRQDVFIGNILKCRPPDNRDPKPDEIISCLPYLHDQLEIINPEIIIALGAHAARTLLETNKPIGQLRGRFTEYYPGIGKPPIKVMATYHPAYLLRNYSIENKKRVWEDMKKVLTELDLPIP